MEKEKPEIFSSDMGYDTWKRKQLELLFPYKTKVFKTDIESKTDEIIEEIAS